VHDRVLSQAFTALPHRFSGVDFALIPSRGEPFGLGGVGFDRKRALGAGSHLGFPGIMPDWRFSVESS
jgi:alpha-1,3-glucan synthase